VPEPLVVARAREPVDKETISCYSRRHINVYVSTWRIVSLHCGGVGIGGEMVGRWHRRPPVEDAAFLLKRLEPAPNGYIM